MQNSSCDIIIVGGGMVGLSLALLLAQKTSLSIVILESQANLQPWDSTSYHHRVSAFALSSQRIFQSLGVWDEIRAQRVSPFKKIKVWDAAGIGHIEFDSRDVAQALLGYIIENNLIQNVLQEKVKTYPQVKLINGVALEIFHQDDNHVTLTTADNHVYTARLAVAADGAKSWLREQAGLQINKHDYADHAIVTTVETALPHQCIASQVFLPTGPLAFLPLANANTSSIVWSLASDEAQQMQQLDDEIFMQKLAAAFNHHLGDVLTISKRYLFPLGKHHAENYVKSRVVLVGDAAHTIHPLAGQGVNMGLLDAAALCDILVEALQDQRDIGNKKSLRRYERWRKADNLGLLTGVDFIKHLFASDKKTVQYARSLGLNVTNHTQWLKNIFIKHAVGDRAGLPASAQG